MIGALDEGGTDRLEEADFFADVAGLIGGRCQGERLRQR